MNLIGHSTAQHHGFDAPIFI